MINVARSSERSIEFTHTTTWSKWAAHHHCDLNGADELVSRGEERYARRASCERVDMRQAQGIPHRCR